MAFQGNPGQPLLPVPAQLAARPAMVGPMSGTQPQMQRPMPPQPVNLNDPQRRLAMSRMLQSQHPLHRAADEAKLGQLREVIMQAVHGVDGFTVDQYNIKASPQTGEVTITIKGKFGL